MKTFKEFLSEMAKQLGYSYNPFTDDKIRKDMYSLSKDHEISHHVNDHINVHKKETPDSIEYHTNDNRNNETLHYSNVLKHKPNNKLNFYHHEQNQVLRKSSDDLPRHYSEDFIYNHFKNSNVPLKSSDTQFKKGHTMWRNLSHKALDDGYHVYYHDGDRLNKSTKNNIDDHLNSYFGVSDDHENKHMILSKKEL